MDVKVVDIGGIPTKIRTLGKSLDEPFEKKEVVLCITGNPGITGFYVTFIATLFKFLQGNTPVWIIGHGGHDEIHDESSKIPSLKNNKHLYDIKGQIDHKLEFIRKYIPADVKIHLVGHSIGAYISLQLFEFDDISERIHHCYLLFPTLEYMADSPNGKLYTMLVRKNFTILLSLLKFLALLPEIVRKVMIMIFFWIRSYPQEHVRSALTYIQPKVISKIVHMADDEMDKVVEPNYKLIEDNKQRLTFFYSTTDGWTPRDHYDRLVSQISDVKAQITDKFDHSFVLKSSYNMGALLAEWIQNNA